MSLVPVVVEKTPQGERSYDLYSRMMKDRVIFFNGVVEDAMASIICAQLLYLESQGPSEAIHMYINSPGGSVTAGLSIYNTMQFISCPVHTYVLGQACSMGSFLAQAGAPGHRYVLEEARTMIHRVSAGSAGTQGPINIMEDQLEDVKRSVEEAQRLNERLTEIYAKHNSAGKDYAFFKETMKYDTFLSADEAIEWGLADVKVTSRDELDF